MRQGPKRQSLNLRIKVEERGLIDRAAKTLGKNRTDFMLDAARRAAEDALLDRTIFTATPKAYAEFLARLDAPPQPNERLRKTLRTKAPWEQGWRYPLLGPSAPTIKSEILPPVLFPLMSGSNGGHSPTRRVALRRRSRCAKPTGSLPILPWLPAP